VRTDTHTVRQTDKQTKVKTAYPPVSLRSLGGYKKKNREKSERRGGILERFY